VLTVATILAGSAVRATGATPGF
jgi:hypothetical protein